MTPAAAPSPALATAPARILVVGESLIDVVLHPDGRREEHPGGSPANVAMTLGRLGEGPVLLTQVGDDDYGRRVRDWLETSNVRLDPRSLQHGPTSVALARLDGAGAASYEFRLSWDLETADPGAVDLVHIGSIGATMEPGCHSVQALVERARPGALVSYDPNIRPALISDPPRARDQIERLVGLADLVKLSDEDLDWIGPGADHDDIARRWLQRGPAIVVITRGRAGASVFTRSGRRDVPAPQVQVVDTVGAGDTLTGAMLASLADAGLLSGSDPASARRRRLAELSVDAVAGHVGHGVRAAAITVSRAGANPPWSRELAA